MDKGKKFYSTLYSLVLNHYDFTFEELKDIVDVHKIVCKLIKERKINNEIIKLFIDDNYEDSFKEIENDCLENCFDIYLKDLRKVLGHFSK